MSRLLGQYLFAQKFAAVSIRRLPRVVRADWRFAAFVRYHVRIYSSRSSQLAVQEGVKVVSKDVGTTISSDFDFIEEERRKEEIETLEERGKIFKIRLRGYMRHNAERFMVKDEIGRRALRM